MMGDAAKFTPASRILKEKLAEYEAENGSLVDPQKGRVLSRINLKLKML